MRCHWSYVPNEAGTVSKVSFLSSVGVTMNNVCPLLPQRGEGRDTGLEGRPLFLASPELCSPDQLICLCLFIDLFLRQTFVISPGLALIPELPASASKALGEQVCHHAGL